MIGHGVRASCCANFMPICLPSLMQRAGQQVLANVTDADSMQSVDGDEPEYFASASRDAPGLGLEFAHPHHF